MSVAPGRTFQSRARHIQRAFSLYQSPSATAPSRTYLTMFFNALVASVAIAASMIGQVHAHGTITAVTGLLTPSSFGIIPTTPRDGSTANPFEQDTSVIKNNEIASGKTGVCGRTRAGGNNDVAAQLAAASTAGLPTASSNGTVSMTLHQVNGDGAGPYTCDVSGDGGNTFVAATVTTQVPGRNGRSQAKAQDFPLEVQMPTGMACAGGPNGDACIVRCRNPVGPFGSCVAVAGSDSASNATVAAAPTAAAAASAASAAVPAASSPAAVSGAALTPPAATAATAAPAAVSGVTAEVPATADASTAAPAAAASPAAAEASTAANAAAAAKRAVVNHKRIITSRVAGKRAGYWIDA
ncbi:hypothetical protein EW146_g4499 [Bondarzewia mesenterica]|uniref:Uncharacterized protein n=1 Tax=Bondarzewia mesenterica TaxID=1095465 RepID=A0A4S4LUD9_9AGAM|nr:hypothetical protein EW146_g4499 [Bondarzewia mesenterica]